MGHQSNDARKALRAYARDLHSTAGRGGLVSPIDAAKQDDAPIQFLGSGAPHQLAIAAAVVCVVLLGGIGLAAATNSTAVSKSGLTNPASAQALTVSPVLIDVDGISTTNAIRAFNGLGLSRAAAALDAAVGSGSDSSPTVQEALGELFEIINTRLTASEPIHEDDVTMALAISDLEAAVRPPGLDIDRVRPGTRETPPGLDDIWLAQVRDRAEGTPDKAPLLVPPGHEKTEPPAKGRDTAPGQTKDKPTKGNGKP